MRPVLAVVVGAAAAGLGGLIVGEYPFTGLTPYVAGLLFGLVIGEIMVTVAGRTSRPLAAACAAFAGLGLAYAVWDDSGYGIRPIHAGAWVGVALATVVAAVRAGAVSRPR